MTACCIPTREKSTIPEILVCRMGKEFFIKSVLLREFQKYWIVSNLNVFKQRNYLKTSIPAHTSSASPSKFA
jgi:hypothetical protein